jgi:hypothetical protein
MASRLVSTIIPAVAVGLINLNPVADLTINQANNIAFEITSVPRKVLANESLPFRLRISNIGLDGYTRQNPAPIGVAIIGYSNYIL